MSENLTDYAVHRLEEEIAEGILLPRERLTEAAIATRLGISRAPIREALRMLDREGLIERAGQGFIVSEISIEDAKDIFETIAFVEELYTRRAAEHMNDADVQSLKGLLAQMDEVAATGNVALYPQINHAFHEVIQLACPNKSLLKLVETVSKRTLRYRRFAVRIPGHLQQSAVDHARIADAILAKDPVAAGKAARKAAMETFKRVKKALQLVGRLG